METTVQARINSSCRTSVTLAAWFPAAARKIFFKATSLTDNGMFLTQSLVGETNIFGFLSFCLVTAST